MASPKGQATTELPKEHSGSVNPVAAQEKVAIRVSSWKMMGLGRSADQLQLQLQLFSQVIQLAAFRICAGASVCIQSGAGQIDNTEMSTIVAAGDFCRAAIRLHVAGMGRCTCHC